MTIIRPKNIQEKKIVISASRRTDIPAFYMKWFLESIDKGCFEIENPYNKKVSFIYTDTIDTIVFWSKNFGPFLSGGFGDKLRQKGFNLFFNFTVNSPSFLEPGIPPLDERLRQLEKMSLIFGPKTINWRFDPVCFYKIDKNKIQNNLDYFEKIADTAARCSIERCITSFLDIYPKIEKRTKSIKGFSFIDPPIEDKRGILSNMEKYLAQTGIQLYVCCEADVMQTLDLNSSIKKSSCIDNALISKLFGSDLSYNRDTGQRINKGCGCKKSSDIGSYRLHPCFHNCLFCYANPSAKAK